MAIIRCGGEEACVLRWTEGRIRKDDEMGWIEALFSEDERG